MYLQAYGYGLVLCIYFFQVVLDIGFLFLAVFGDIVFYDEHMFFICILCLHVFMCEWV